MKLYHGSTIDIAKVDLALSKPNKDFGRAFYLSDDRQQALEMAQFRAEFEETEPVVNVYEFDEALFQEFRYKRFEAYTEEWAHFVYDHRTEPHGRTLHDYDIVYGPIARSTFGRLACPRTTASARRSPATSRATSPSTSSCAASSTSRASPSNTPSAPSGLLTN